MSRVDELLSFWFGQPRDEKSYFDEWHPRWFAHDPQFDQVVRDHFLADYQLAAEQKLTDWQNQPRSGLALVLLLDQIPRNIFRGDKRAFATDALARETTVHLMSQGFDRQLLPVERFFLYLPFMHSEQLSDQQRSVALYQQLAQKTSYLDVVSFATQHLEIIQRFGRFPHRNFPLNRPSTAEEETFLRQPGSSF